MDTEGMYEIVADAVRAVLAEQAGGTEVRIHKRMLQGEVVFRDGEGKVVKAMPALPFFRKVTAIREKLRVLEQKINSHPALSDEDRAEMQAYITRSYGSLTTFNFMFLEEDDKFKGTGSE